MQAVQLRYTLLSKGDSPGLIKGNLRMHVFEKPVATASELFSLFPFNLSSHKHIYIDKCLFSIFRDD